MEEMRKGALCLLFLEDILENCYHLFLKFLLDFISGIIWACCCLNQKLITYRLNFYNRCRPYPFISFTCKILINYILQQFLNLIFIFVGIELFIIFIYCPFNVRDISSHGPSFISTVCNVICVFLVFLISLLRISSFLVSEKQLLVLLFLSIVFLFPVLQIAPLFLFHLLLSFFHKFTKNVDYEF